MRVKMNDWDDPEAKAAAVKEFRKRVSKDPHLRARCLNDKNEARRIFADCGNFYLAEDPNLSAGVSAIPVDTEFRVFEGGDYESRGKLITLVLRDRQTTEAIKAEMPDPAHVWMCTYYPWPPGPPIEDDATS